MTPQGFLTTAVNPACSALLLDATEARQLLLETAIHESKLEDIQQIDGPALGPFQMEPGTHQDIWDNFLSTRSGLAMKIRKLLPAGTIINSSLLIGHPQYAAAMARVFYFRVPAAIPCTLAGRAAYYKQYYNTPAGAATPEEYINDTLAMLSQFPLDPSDPLAVAYANETRS